MLKVLPFLPKPPQSRKTVVEVVMMEKNKVCGSMVHTGCFQNHGLKRRLKKTSTTRKRSMSLLGVSAIHIIWKEAPKWTSSQKKKKIFCSNPNTVHAVMMERGNPSKKWESCRDTLSKKKRIFNFLFYKII